MIDTNNPYLFTLSENVSFLYVVHMVKLAGVSSSMTVIYLLNGLFD